MEAPRNFNQQEAPLLIQQAQGDEHVQQVREPRIVGGTKTEFNQYPYFVRIDNVKSRTRGICGGTLVAPDMC